MEYQGLNSVQYEYEKRVEGSYKIKRLLYIISCVAVSLGLILTVCTIGGPFVYTVPVIFIICLIVSRLFFMFFQISYKYKIEGGVFTAYIIYGGRRIKEYYHVDLRQAEAIEPYDASKNQHGTVYPSCISLAKPSPELYAIVFKTEAGKDAVAYFEASKAALKVMKYFKEDTVISDKVRH